MDKRISELHKKACERGEDTYIDPDTGYLVFTELFHKRRGHCCQSGCRHCPYGFNKKSNDEDSQN
ncbi:DUF5522 domain-containing protein [Bdellovibrio sp. HCB-162]|uniref:DUF5522 domain-containing protein n=1 Tax=Bdellovibrio sp. HCB-162 TaxID=3394234 RepID=UPI0039BD5F4D